MSRIATAFLVTSLSALLASAACTPLAPSCPDATFYALAGAASGNGSETQPFGTIAAALAAAPSVADSCEVITVYLQGGTFNENVTLPRSLQLIGKEGAVIRGRIENLGGHDLYLDRLAIQAAPSYGVLQAGGMLEMRSVTVSGTVANANDLASGTGILIKGGAVADLSLVNSNDNQGQGLAATDAGTTVKVSVATISRNQANSLAQSQFTTLETHVGAVEARHGAYLSMQTITLEDNLGFGARVSRGARAFLKGGAIRGTRDISFGRGNISANASVSHLSELEMQDITLERSFVGVIAFQGFFTMLGGQITRNEIGAAFAYRDLRAVAPGYDPSLCIDRVIFRDNGRVADYQDLLPIPLPPDLDGTPAPIPAAFCRRVSP